MMTKVFAHHHILVMAFGVADKGYFASGINCTMKLHISSKKDMKGTSFASSTLRRYLYLSSLSISSWLLRRNLCIPVLSGRVVKAVGHH